MAIQFTRYAPVNWLLNIIFVIASIMVMASFFSNMHFNCVDVERQMYTKDINGGDATAFRPGEAYLLNMKVHYNTTCTVHAANKLVRIDPNNPDVRLFTWNYGTDSGTIQAGEFEGNTAFKIPDFVPPGSYLHIRESFYDCGYSHHTESWRPAPITVLKK